MSMPLLLYGTAWKEASTASFVEKAIRKGFRGVDTACQPKHYNEAGAGKGLVASGVPREELFIQVGCFLLLHFAIDFDTTQTKFSPLHAQDHRVPYDAQAPLSQQVEQSLQVSLRNLQTDYIDSLLLHSAMPDNQLLEIWRSNQITCHFPIVLLKLYFVFIRAFELLVKSGRVRRLGVSNTGLRQLQLLVDTSSIKPSIVQNPFHAANQFDSALREYCRDNDICYQSFWTLTANPTLLRRSETTSNFFVFF
jgi:diketogulonate reductase-like aldo/keto reductase